MFRPSGAEPTKLFTADVIACETTDTAAVTNAVVAIWVVFVPAAAVGALGVPVNVGDAMFAFLAISLVTVVAKFSSLPNAVASSWSVFRASGAAPISASIAAATAVATNAVVATWVVLFPWAGVGAIGVPVNVGDSKSALSSNFCCPAKVRLSRSVFAAPSIIPR